MVAVENTADVHNIVVCTLCSCYPWPVLGLPPSWYKSAPYRSRAVIDPAAVLAEFGVRLPAYIRNHVGSVHAVHGVHVYPDTNALGQGENAQWQYNVKFTAEELWGKPRSQHSFIHVDCWDPYLEPVNYE